MALGDQGPWQQPLQPVTLLEGFIVRVNFPLTFGTKTGVDPVQIAAHQRLLGIGDPSTMWTTRMLDGGVIHPILARPPPSSHGDDLTAAAPLVGLGHRVQQDRVHVAARSQLVEPSSAMIARRPLRSPGWMSSMETYCSSSGRSPTSS